MEKTCTNCGHNVPSDFDKHCRYCFANGRKHYIPKRTTDQERRYTYKVALEKYGLTAQDMMAIEEMSELTKEICKVFRGKGNLEALADEIADVTIMLEQLQLFYDLEQSVQDHVDMKIRRLQNRLGMKEGADE